MTDPTPARERHALQLGRAHGIAYGTVDADLRAALEAGIDRWNSADRGDEQQEVRAGQNGEIALKFAGPERWLRRSRALRSAERAIAILESTPRGSLVRVPEPRCALEWGTGLRIAGSVLASEFIVGRSLFEVWHTDERAVLAFPHFVAELHRREILHGDFHPENVLWDGERWALLDLQWVRDRVAPWRRGWFVERQWARVLRALDFDPRVHRLIALYAADIASAPDLGTRVEAAARSLPPIPAEKLAEIRAHLGPA